MKGIGIIVISVFLSLVSAGDIYYDLRDAPFLFHKFILTYNRNYENTADLLEHYGAFITNLYQINKLNKKDPLATFDINKFADYTEEENKHLTGDITPKIPTRGRGQGRSRDRRHPLADLRHRSYYSWQKNKKL